MFSNRLLCSPKDYCVSEQKLSCVLPLWATVQMTNVLKRGQTITLSFYSVRFLTIEITRYKSSSNSLRCLHPLNTGIFFTMFKVGKERWDLHCCPLNRGCLLTTYRFDCSTLQRREHKNSFVPLESGLWVQILQYHQLLGVEVLTYQSVLDKAASSLLFVQQILADQAIF